MKEEVLKTIFFCLILGVPLLGSAISRHRRARKIQDTPRSKASSAPQGYVELQGYAWPKSGFVNNSQGQPAVYYEFLLQKEVSKGSGKNRRREWITVFQTKLDLPFYLVDPTGVVGINPQLSDFEIEKKRTQNWLKIEAAAQGRLLEEVITSSVADFPPRKGFFGLFSSNFRICETEILAGSPLHASGDFRSPSGTSELITQKGMTKFANKVFDLEGRSFRNLTRILDTNKDGKVSFEEAKRGLSIFANSILKSKEPDSDEKVFELYGQLLSTPSHKLFLSDSHEEQLVERLKRFLVLRFLGGGSLVSVALFLTLTQFNPAPWSLGNDAVPARSVASENKLKRQTQVLHEYCSTNSFESCLMLIDRDKSGEYKLSPEYVKYYTAQACRLGHTESCENKSTDKPSQQ